MQAHSDTAHPHSHTWPAHTHSRSVGLGWQQSCPGDGFHMPPTPQTGLCPERAKDPEGAAPCLRRPENRGQTAQSPECSDVFKDRLLVSVLVLMRARPALGWGSFLEAAVWGRDTQATQPEVTARGRHRETVSQHQRSRPGRRSCRPRAAPQCGWDPGKPAGPAQASGAGQGLLEAPSFHNPSPPKDLPV